MSFATYLENLRAKEDHEKKRFVPKVDFVTAPGYLDGGTSRKDAGLLAGGAYKVITHLGIFGFEPESKRMCLETLHPGATVEEVKARTGFEMLIPKKIEYTKAPTDEELRILRELDPDKRYTTPKAE